MKLELSENEYDAIGRFGRGSAAATVRLHRIHT